MGLCWVRPCCCSVDPFNYFRYVSSRKFVQDIKSFTCNNYIGVAQSHVTGIPMCADPVYPSMLFTKILKDSNVSNPEGGIKFAIALDQIGSINQVSSDGDTELHIHSSKLDSTVLSKIKIAAESTSKIILTPSTTTAMPPSPLSSFSRELGALSEECAVITGYGDSFTDPRYHSHYDNASFVSDVAVIR